MREWTNKRTYTTTKHITTLLLRSQVKTIHSTATHYSQIRTKHRQNYETQQTVNSTYIEGDLSMVFAGVSACMFCTGLPDWVINCKMGDLKNDFASKKWNLLLATNWATWPVKNRKLGFFTWSRSAHAVVSNSFRSPYSGLFLLNKYNSSYYMVLMLFLLKSLFLRNSNSAAICDIRFVLILNLIVFVTLLFQWTYFNIKKKI